MATKQPARNILRANYRADTQDTRLAQLNKNLGILGVDDMIAIQADGTLTISGADESNGVPYNGGSNAAPTTLPTVRKSDPTPGMPGA